MRHLLPGLALAQVAGIGLSSLGLPTEIALGLGFAALGAGALLGVSRLRALAALALAFASGALALGLQAAAATPPPAGRAPLTLEGTVQEVRNARARVQVELAEVAGTGEGLPRRIRLSGEPGFALDDSAPGQRLRLRARLHGPAPRRNPGARSGDLRRAGVGAVGRPDHPALVVRLADGEGLRPLAFVVRWRRLLGARLLRTGEGGALLAALSLGDRGGLRSDTRDHFARLGLSHLLAVSGLHLALVAGLAFASFRFAASRSAALCARADARLVALLPAALVAVGYALLAGWGVPVRRALVFLGAAMGAASLTRSTTPAAPFAAAALWVLAAAPHALFEAGTQLSFAAAFALVVAARRGRSATAGPRWLRALVLGAPAIGITAPIAAWHFGEAAPAALLANALAVPWTAFVLLPAAGLGTAGAALSGAPGADLVLAFCERIAALSLGAVERVGALVPHRGPPARPAFPWLVAAGLLGLGTAFAGRETMRLAFALGTGVLLALARPAALEPPPPRIVALDVGQGDAIVVQGRGGVVLIDAGTALPDGIDLGRYTVVPALGALGVRHVDLLVASHADLDHRGGIPFVLGRVSVGRVWLPHGSRRDEGLAAVLEAARRAGVTVEERGAGDAALELGDVRVAPLWPPRGYGGSRNDRSLVVRIEVGGRRLLLPGDLEAAGEAALLATGADLRADVLKLAHHGSRTSSTRAFLAAVGAGIAIASAPCAGRFGMPHEGVVARVREVGASLAWTGRDGAVSVALAERLVVHPWLVRPRACAQPTTDSVPSKAITSGRQTKRRGGISTRPVAMEAETG